MSLIKFIIEWLKPGVSVVLSDGDLQDFIKQKSKIVLSSLDEAKDHRIDLIYITHHSDFTTLLDIVQPNGFIITSSYPIELKNNRLCEYIKLDNHIVIKKTVNGLEWLPEYLGATSPKDKLDTVQRFSEAKTDYIPIYMRNVPPPPETFDHAGFLSRCAQTIPDCVYIEYGVRDGDSIVRIQPHTSACYGVDMKPGKNQLPNIGFFQMTTNMFSERFLPHIQFDMAFIDADHKSESAFTDFTHIFKHIRTGGYIFLHDTYPFHQSFLATDCCNDCYRTPILIKEIYHGYCEVLTLPFNPGLTIVRKL